MGERATAVLLLLLLVRTAEIGSDGAEDEDRDGVTVGAEGETVVGAGGNEGRATAEEGAPPAARNGMEITFRDVAVERLHCTSSICLFRANRRSFGTMTNRHHR